MAAAFTTVLKIPSLYTKRFIVHSIYIYKYTPTTKPQTPYTQQSSNPVALLQLQRQVDLGQVLEPGAAQRLDLCLLLGLEHQLQLGDPLGVGLDKVLLQLGQGGG